MNERCRLCYQYFGGGGGLECGKTRLFRENWLTSD